MNGYLFLISCRIYKIRIQNINDIYKYPKHQTKKPPEKLRRLEIGRAYITESRTFEWCFVITGGKKKGG
jgi:hypothetical protein